VPSISANKVLVYIAQQLPLLEHLLLHLPFVQVSASQAPPPHSTDISVETVRALQSGCPALRSLELSGALVSFDTSAFLQLAHCPQLRRLKVLYEEALVDALPALLTGADFLDEVVFYENAADFLDEQVVVQAWEHMEERLQTVSEQFPAVRIGLTDNWWSS
jgi:hypothetical protein